MESHAYKIFPLGDSALTVEFGNRIDLEINQLVIGLADSISAEPFEGFIESVPAYSSVTVFYEPVSVRNNSLLPESPHSIVAGIVANRINRINQSKSGSSKPIKVPVDFGKRSAPDLPFVAKANGLSEKDVIDIFIGRSYRVFMLGFMPGFPYMGLVDHRIAAPRMDEPRIRVPKGSVGIAGRQTGIYPLESPGGWRLIGRTELELFSKDTDDPALFAPGDRVKFTRA